MIKEILKHIPIYGTSSQLKFHQLEKYLEKNKRDEKIPFEGKDQIKLNLNLTLPGVQSYLALGFPYPVYFPKLKNYMISAYSVIDDYHEVLKSELKKMIKRLQVLYPNEKFVPLVDSGKAFEKWLAYEAGIGFFGNHSLIIHPDYGSYFFIGVILTTAMLPKLQSHSIKGFTCGYCDLCSQACPAGAVDSKRIHAKKCYSYLTQDRERNGDAVTKPYIWGCDLCQMVCPYNFNRKRDTWEGFQYRFKDQLLNPKINSVEYEILSKKLPISWKSKDNWIKNLYIPDKTQGIS